MRDENVSGVKHTPGPIWSCKIGVTGSADVPMGGDSPMRRAVEGAFQRLIGQQPDFIFSGWSAELTEPELAVVESRWASEEYFASERLRDAAPDLLEALEALVDRDLTYDGPCIVIPAKNHSDAISIVRRARNSIARARGEQS